MKDFQELLAKAKERGQKRCVVACAEDFPTLEALHNAKQENIATGILFGDQMRIEKIAESLKLSLADFEIHHCSNEADSVRDAVNYVSENGDFLMKGMVNTATFLKGILDEKQGLRGERVLSHVALLSLATYHKVLFVSDGGMNTDLDLRRKIDIVKNAIELVRFLGISQPRVALLSAIERVNLNLTETLDWAIITRMAEQAEFGDALIEGPLALDIAFSTQSAKIKKVASRVSGDVDVLIVPSIATGNILAKGLQYLGGAKICGIIVGAKRPVVMLSRADTPETKLFSIALGNLAS
jgi:phosphotransacetylase